MKKYLILFLLMLPGLAFGASSRILPTSYDEYTYDSAGGGEDYTALATWEADTDINLVTATKGKVLTCSSGVHNDSIALSGATTSSSYFRVIRAASGSRGTPTSGVRFVKSATANFILISIEENYFQVQDLAGSVYTSSGYAICFSDSGASDGPHYIKIIGCTAYNTSSATSIARGFALNSSTGSVMANCFADAITGTSTSTAGFFFYSITSDYSYYCYNNTATDCTSGFFSYKNTGTCTVIAKNCIAQNNTTNFNTYNGGTFTQTTNATSGVTFASDGYHLASSDTAAIGEGTDLSSDSVFPFNDDIDGDTRTGTWDIGCDEYIITAKPQVIIY